MDMDQNYKPGEIVYIIIRNPHVQDVAHVQQAAIVQHPENPNKLALFTHDNYYPVTDELAIFTTEEEAENAYQEAFGSFENGEFYG
ncbi:transcriptional regulator SplA domain-containing protein [Bacillus sp. FSL K6-3431]|uniref:transcriptional regulator SplA domain-containing protein n=1 Tax=Bacillus sp. FSL K6-3431 TaxID=2921500 RepID=UPI0030FB4580